MKFVTKHRSGLILLAVVALAASLLGGALLPANAQALTSTINQKVPLAMLTFVPCANGGAGEPVFLTGTLHSVFHITISASGNVVVKIHDQPQGVKGVGLITGDVYQGNGVTQSTQTMQADALPLTITAVNVFNIIGPGRNNNFLLKQNTHLTINNNGVVTATVGNSSVTCK